MKLLFVHERFPPDYAGGGEYVVAEMAQRLRRRGHAVAVVAAGNPAIRDYEGIPTRRLPVTRYGFNLAWKTVAEHARDADIIQTFTYHGMYPAYRAGRALRKPVVCAVLALFGGAWRQMRGPVAGRIFERLERYLLGLPVEARVFLSESSRELAREMGVERPGDVVIEPGISLEEYRVDPQKTFVLFAGKLDVRKGIDTVLSVARALPEIPFHVIGWGERYGEIDANKPSNLSLERFTSRRQLADALSRARVFLFPTQAETFGLVVAEAMASGCAIVSTSPLPFQGVRLSAADSDSVCRSVHELWNDRERCRACGNANQELARRYSWQRHVDRLEQLYQQLT